MRSIEDVIEDDRRERDRQWKAWFDDHRKSHPSDGRPPYLSAGLSRKPSTKVLREDHGMGVGPLWVVVLGVTVAFVLFYYLAKIGALR